MENVVLEMTDAKGKSVTNVQSGIMRSEDNLNYVLLEAHWEQLRSGIIYRKCCHDEFHTKRNIAIRFQPSKAVVYVPELATILMSNEVPALDCLNKNKETIFDGQIFQEVYIEAYKEGEKFFNENYNIDLKTMYGPGAKNIVADFKDKYYNSGMESGGGWEFESTSYSNRITNRSFKENGYYTAIVFKLKELIERYKSVFDDHGFFQKPNEKGIIKKVIEPKLLFKEGKEEKLQNYLLSISAETKDNPKK